MYQMVIEILLVWFAFLLVFWQDHIKAIYHTLRPNLFDWRRWWAVKKGTLNRRTIFPFMVMFTLTVAIIGLNYWQINSSFEAENKRNADLINTINQTINDKLNQRDTDLIDAINRQTEAILKVIQQNGGGQSGQPKPIEPTK